MILRADQKKHINPDGFIDQVHLDKAQVLRYLKNRKEEACRRLAELKADIDVGDEDSDVSTHSPYYYKQLSNKALFDLFQESMLMVPAK